MQTLIKAYLDWAKLYRSAKTVESYGQALSHLTDFLNTRGVSEPAAVDFRLIEDFMLWLHDSGSGARTINHRLAAIRSLWKWMRRYGHATNDPARDVEKLKEAKPLPIYLTMEEQDKFRSGVRKAKGDLARRDEAVIMMALLTGLRRAELCSLRMDEVNLEAGSLRVVNGKGSKSREVSMVPELVGILKRYLPARKRLLHRMESPWMFVSGHAVLNPSPRGPRAIGQPICVQTVFRLVRFAAKRFIGRRISPHVLRHSFATRLRERGADIQLIQECLGHADISTTTIYASLATSRRRELLVKLLARR